MLKDLELCVPLASESGHGADLLASGSPSKKILLGTELWAVQPQAQVLPTHICWVSYPAASISSAWSTRTVVVREPDSCSLLLLTPGLWEAGIVLSEGGCPLVPTGGRS